MTDENKKKPLPWESIQKIYYLNKKTKELEEYLEDGHYIIEHGYFIHEAEAERLAGLEEENKTLREALEKIKQMNETDFDDYGPVIAQEALEKLKKK